MAAKASDIRAGGAMVEISANDAGLQKGLDAAKAKFGTFVASLQTAGAALAFSSITGQITGMVRGLADGGREMFLLSQKTRISVEELDELKKASAELGVDFGSVTTGLRFMQRFLQGIDDSGEDSNKTLRALGLTLSELQTMSTADQMTILTERLDELTDAGSATANAMRIFGRGGQDMLTMGNRFRQARANASEGGLIDPNSVAMANELALAWQRLERAQSSVSKAVASALLPMFKPIIEAIMPIITATRTWVGENRTLVQGLGFLVAISGAAAAALTSIAAAAYIVPVVFRGVNTAIMGLFDAGKALIGLLGSKLGLAVIGLAGVGVYLVATNEKVKASLSGLWNGLKETVVDTMAGIMNAMDAGNLGLSWSIAVAGMKVTWARFTDWFGKTIPAFDEASEVIGSSIAYFADRVLPGTAATYHEDSARRRRDRQNGVNPALQLVEEELAALISQAASERQIQVEKRKKALLGPERTRDIEKEMQGGTRGLFNATAAFGLVGAGSGPLNSIAQNTQYTVQQLQAMNANIQNIPLAAFSQ